ncbi:C39 family peptidase [Clostridium cellulovorans]|uniref:Peptidase C39-like domain-containing protein n=1 Tax=Clostridium cellulovorans (strain ATCC 35296 / DSM 3052 / OCM 3 / 743B) TaxID=573061 RepID=D9SWW7_CLOC7|nr:C39 family peptidase [Clostridium cellulovorans]ADL51328.1 hypothetical protein Clocel_1580 [Clostridium cellulovorans 743B]
MLKRKFSTIFVAITLIMIMTAPVFGDNITSVKNEITTTESSAVNYVPQSGENVGNGKVILTQEDINGNEKKSREVGNYLEQKNKTSKNSTRLLKGYYSSTSLNYDHVLSPEAQSTDTWCGPAACLNAIDTRSYHSVGQNTNLTQFVINSFLNPGGGLQLNGTYLTSNWTTTLDKFAPGNNYEIKRRASSVNYTDWQLDVLNSIIYTIDKGYPVVVDTEQMPTIDFIDPVYRDRYNSNGNKPIYHYVTVIGYRYTGPDPLCKYGGYQLIYMDSAGYHNGVYETDYRRIGNTTIRMGIMW